VSWGDQDPGLANGTSAVGGPPDRGHHLSAVGFGEDAFRWWIPDQERLPWGEDPAAFHLDSTQRPLQGAFLIPPVPPVVLIAVGFGEDAFRWWIPDQERLPWGEDPAAFHLDSTQRPLQGAFLIPPVPPVVLIGTQGASTRIASANRVGPEPPYSRSIPSWRVNPKLGASRQG
jgi:hypothetical protein